MKKRIFIILLLLFSVVCFARIDNVKESQRFKTFREGGDIEKFLNDTIRWVEEFYAELAVRLNWVLEKFDVINIDKDAPDDSITIDSSGNVVVKGTLRSSTSVWWHIQHIDMSAVSKGASNAVWTAQSANNLNGFQLDGDTEYLYFNTHVRDNWDGASDLEVIVRFETNANNSGGADADTVNFDLVMYFKGDTETTQKTQVLTGSITVGKAAQYYHGSVTFTINWDLANHVVQVGDCCSWRLNLDTGNSDVDDVIVHHGMFRYKTTKPSAEV